MLELCSEVGVLAHVVAVISSEVGVLAHVVAEEVATEVVPSSECIESHMTARGCWPDEAA